MRYTITIKLDTDAQKHDFPQIFRILEDAAQTARVLVGSVCVGTKFQNPLVDDTGRPVGMVTVEHRGAVFGEGA